jgi:hypothetical protein
MRWIQASLTLVVLLVGLALGKAEAAEERPGRVDGAPADAVCGVIHAGLPGADFHGVPIPSVDLSAPIDSPIRAPSFLADTPYIGLLPSLDNPIPALPFPIETPPVAVTCQRRCPAGWPATAVRRLTWLQRFLF